MTPNADDPEYLKVEEVAARLKLKEKTIRDWILRGELPAYKLGKGMAHPPRRLRSGDAGTPHHRRARADRRSLGSGRSRVTPFGLVCR